MKAQTKTETKTDESTTICEDVATLSPPAKVALPTLTHKKSKTPPVSVDGLPDMAKRISQIPPTATTRRKVDRPSAGRTSTSLSSPGVKREKTPQARAYERPERAFD